MKFIFKEKLRLLTDVFHIVSFYCIVVHKETDFLLARIVLLQCMMLVSLIVHNDIEDLIVYHMVDMVHCDIELNIDDDHRSDHMAKFDRKISHKLVTKSKEHSLSLNEILF
jgi:hypothetical protein